MEYKILSESMVFYAVENDEGKYLNNKLSASYLKPDIMFFDDKNVAQNTGDYTGFPNVVKVKLVVIE